MKDWCAGSDTSPAVQLYTYIFALLIYTYDWGGARRTELERPGVACNALSGAREGPGNDDRCRGWGKAPPDTKTSALKLLLRFCEFSLTYTELNDLDAPSSREALPARSRRPLPTPVQPRKSSPGCLHARPSRQPGPRPRQERTRRQR